MNNWKCAVCKEVVRSESVPLKCPICGVGSEHFTKIESEEVSFSSTQYTKIVVIGASAAAISAVEEIRNRNKVCDITVISSESTYGYYRPQLSKILGKEIDYSKLFIKDYNWFKENNIEVMLEKRVVEINNREKTVLLDTCLLVEYDTLIIATGAECFTPPMKGKCNKGFFRLRKLDDVNKIVAYAKDVKKAVVIGGGVLGLETAWELKLLGLDVTVVEYANRILPRQLDEDGSELLKKIILDAGIKLILDDSVTLVTGDKITDGVNLSSGKNFETDMVVLSAGIKPNVKLGEDIAMKINRAIVVNKKMQTSIENIYACGDCCEYEGINYALWPEAIEQGKVAGINAIGDEASYVTITPSTTLNAFNTKIFSVGDIGIGADEKYSFEIEKDSNSYKKLVYLKDELIGGIIIGNNDGVKELSDKLL